MPPLNAQLSYDADSEVVSLFFPITRASEEERMVEGYAFTAEVVEGERGADGKPIRLLRKAMEEATGDYLHLGSGALREMHQPKAAGQVPLVEWNQRGAFIRSYVDDDQAWAKCRPHPKTGTATYKGFSVGVRATEIKNGVITRCRWLETSLVDRPKDPGARITVARAEGYEPPPVAGPEPEAEEPQVERSITAATAALPVRENLEGKIPRALHYACGSEDCHAHVTVSGASECSGKMAAAEKTERADTASAASAGVNHYLCGEKTCCSHTGRGAALECMMRRGDVDAIDGLYRSEETEEAAQERFERGDGSKEPYGDVEYADNGLQADGQKRYPIDTDEHIHAAWSYINKEKNAAKYSSEHLAAVKSKIRAAAKRIGMEIEGGDVDSDADSDGGAQRMDAFVAAIAQATDTPASILQDIVTRSLPLLTDGIVQPPPLMGQREPSFPVGQHDSQPAGEGGETTNTAGFADPGFRGDGVARYPLMTGGEYDPALIEAAWLALHEDEGERDAYSPAQLKELLLKVKAASALLGISLPPYASDMPATPLLPQQGHHRADAPAPGADLVAIDATRDVKLRQATILAAMRIYGMSDELMGRLEAAQNELKAQREADQVARAAEAAAQEALIARVATAEAATTAATERAEAERAEREELEGTLASVIERLEKVEAAPAAPAVSPNGVSTRPVLNAAHMDKATLERIFPQVGQANADGPTTDDMTAEYQRLLSPTDEEKEAKAAGDVSRVEALQAARAQSVNLLKNALTSRGAPV